MLDATELAEVIAGLDVYNKCINLTGYSHPLKMVNKRHLVVHLGDLLAASDPTFNRERFEQTCGEGAEPGKVY